MKKKNLAGLQMGKEIIMSLTRNDMYQINGGGETKPPASTTQKTCPTPQTDTKTEPLPGQDSVNHTCDSLGH